nr:unnamed protein product [Callosobruchus chinensis]
MFAQPGYTFSGIESAATASIPIKKPFQPKNRLPPPWWDSECDNIVRQRKQSLINYTNQSTLENYINVQKEIARSKKFLKKKAKQYWIQYCNPIDINNPYNNPVIQQLKLQIHRLINRNFEIILLWIKAHAGLQANEVVDRLAKESIHTGLELANDIFVKECISERKSKMKQMWNNAWKEYCTQRPTRYTFIHPTIPHELWHKDLPYSRSDIVTIARLKFGHACYPYHLNKIGVQTTNICDTCNTVSDLDHIFFGCRKYNAQSNQLHSALIKKKIQSPFNLVSLL